MNFADALKRLLDARHEGGYANNPKDKGGETYKGISRNNWPHWGGWDIIDTERASASPNSGILFDHHLEGFGVLQGSVQSFYLMNFWNPCGAADAPDVVKFDLFDMAVNSGVKSAVRSLQWAVGVTEDGIYGPQTREAMSRDMGIRILFRLDADRLVKWADDDPDDLAEFGRGWAHRLGDNLSRI